MTLTASGRLLIGTPTEATYMLDVNGTGRFTNDLLLKPSSLADIHLTLDRYSTATDGLVWYKTNGVNKWLLGQRGTSSDDFYLYSYGTSSNVLTIAQSTGAATFSNSVAVGTIMSVGSNAGAGSLFQYTFSGANANSRTWRTSIDNVTYGDWALQQATTQGGSTFANILIFSNTGAATFSDSIKTGAPSGGTAKPWKLGQDTSTLYSATRTIQVEIDGGTYYLLAVKSTDL
jgi:hypothetical protein